MDIHIEQYRGVKIDITFDPVALFYRATVTGTEKIGAPWHTRAKDLKALLFACYEYIDAKIDSDAATH